MKVSVILLDWSVRESFHAVNYLNKQTAKRSDYELIWIEYFNRKIPELEDCYKSGLLDKYLIMGNKTEVYNKHKAWNFGVLHSSGDVIVLCDSDAMFKQSFIQNIINFFKESDNQFLYIDEIRSNNKNFYPFNYPSWNDVMTAPGLINWNDKLQLTKGLKQDYDNFPLIKRMYIRNYGACLCVKKSDYIRFGGLDEHECYSGYICGPYELAIRMMNAGLQENWHKNEFLLHTYHPLNALDTDRAGPHIRNNALISIKNLYDGNTMPYVENIQIRNIRKQLIKTPSRKGKIKFSIIVPNAVCKNIQPLYDSIGQSTKQPYEVIFIGNENYEFNQENLKYIKSSEQWYKLIKKGSFNISGEIIVVVPPQAIFRRNMLDKLSDFQKEFQNSIAFLKTMETYTQGFIWQYNLDNSSNPIAFEKKLLPKIIKNLSKKESLKSKRINIVNLNTFTVMEIWHDDKVINNDKLQNIINQMLALNNENLTETQILNNAKSILEQIKIIENNNLGEFFKYFLIKKYNYNEYFEFLNIFSFFDLKEMLIDGLQLFINSSELLLKINENVSEVKWLYELLYDEIVSAVENAYINITLYKLDKNNIKNAVVYLKFRLEKDPNNRFCKKLIHAISEVID